MYKNLAFVPIEDTDNTLLLLSENLLNDLQPLLDWFEDNFVGRMNQRGNLRRMLVFPYKI